MRCLVAFARRQRGVRKVEWSSVLQRSTTLKARRIMVCGYSHTPCGDPASRPFRQAGYLPGASAEEVIAEGAIGHDSPRDVMSDWLLSEDGHGEAILNPRHRQFGVTQRQGQAGGLSGVWVMHLGRRR